jgi:alpha-galactosidase
MTLLHLRGGSTDRPVDLVVHLGAGVPVIEHWGAPLAADDRAVDPGVDLAALGPALALPIVHGGLDHVAPIATVPEHGSASSARPGLAGHRRGGRDWSPRFRPDHHEVETLPPGAPGVGDRGGARLVAHAVDPVAGLRLVTTVQLGHALVVTHELVNEGSDRYLLDGLTVTLPLPETAAELLTFTGRWTRELHQQRVAWPSGAHTVENRRGRTSHEYPPLLYAGVPGFGEWAGEVHGVHVAWSGNHVLLAERLPDGRRYVQGGELLHPGEVVLEPGASYRTPELVAVYAAGGLTPAAWGFHRHLRSRPGHPTTPRPVTLNTWEAVYFDHRTDRLRQLADAAAALGIERFVLDDGWFGSRRDDTRGLGDWWVSPEVYPDGLAPLIDHVRSLGMEFGIWVEPEMVNPDSDLFRAHPEWALTTPGYDPVLGRHQLVLDLANPGAYAHVSAQLHALLRDHDIAYLKWDMNRDHVQGSGADGAAGTHAQTLALYRLLDELAAAFPHVEIESCSSGGARIDHEILRRTRRVWTSDCNDALERQEIQRGASLFIPPEVMGAHVGPTRSHTTGRVHTLAFRAATAMFGHLGVEWDVSALDDRDRAQLADAIALHRELRPLLHGGDTVRFDTEDPYRAHGVYAADRSSAVVSFAVLRSGLSLAPPPLRLPGLDPDGHYRVELLPLPGARSGPVRSTGGWAGDGLELSGRELAARGLRPPVLHPESAALFRLTRR